MDYYQQHAHRMKSTLISFHAFVIIFICLLIGQCAGIEDGKDMELSREQRQEIVGRWQHQIPPGR